MVEKTDIPRCCLTKIMIKKKRKRKNAAENSSIKSLQKEMGRCINISLAFSVLERPEKFKRKEYFILMDGVKQK